MTVLILYSTYNGSTREIAECICSHIAEQFPPTEVHNIRDFDASLLHNYTAVIIGSPVHGIHWLDEAIKFCSANKETLIFKPLFAFSVGAPGALPRILRNKLARLEKRKIYKELQSNLDGKVRMHELFNGMVEKKGEPLIVKLCCGLFGGITYGDLREWDKIEIWVNAVVADLKGAQYVTENGERGIQEA